MTNTYELQLGIIMKNLSKVKREKIEITADNISLRESCKNLKARLSKSEKHKHTLIRMFKQRVVQNDDKVRSLRRENNILQNTVQEQSQTIDEHLSTINKLKEEIEKLKKENDSLKRCQQIKTRNCRCKYNVNKQLKVVNQTNFNHPSFEEGVMKNNKQKKKLKVFPNFRWSNLDVELKGAELLKQDPDSLSTKPGSSKDKKRKLYSPDDSTVDLTNEEEED